MKKLSSFGLLLLATIGCGGQPAGETAQVASQNTAAPTTAATTTPASTSALVANGAGTEPGEVVALFLDSLRRGDETTANSVLTAQAQAELAKTEYVIEPLGTPEGKYNIGRVGYVDNEKTTGLVECTWSEPNPEAGQPPIEMELVCEVHKEPAGWRISGLAAKMPGTEETLVLDFEDGAALQAALRGANSQGAPATEQATAQTLPQGTLPQNTGIVPPGALPSANLPPANLPPALPQQIAMPPLPNAPLPR